MGKKKESTEKSKYWSELKKYGKAISGIFEELYNEGEIESTEKQVKRMKDCSKVWARYRDNTHGISKLGRFNECHQKFCPICGASHQIKWKKIGESVVTQLMSEEAGLKWTLVTLGYKNANSVGLQETYDECNEAVHKLLKYINRSNSYFKDKVSGLSGIVEIGTQHGREDRYYLHVHMLIATYNEHITEEEIRKCWDKYAGVGLHIDVRDIEADKRGLVEQLGNIISYMAKGVHQTIKGFERSEQKEIMKDIYNLKMGNNQRSPFFTGNLRSIYSRIKHKEDKIEEVGEESREILEERVLEWKEVGEVVGVKKKIKRKDESTAEERRKNLMVLDDLTLKKMSWIGMEKKKMKEFKIEEVEYEVWNDRLSMYVVSEKPKRLMVM